MRKDLADLAQSADRAGLSCFPTRDLDAERLTFSTAAMASLPEEELTLVVIELQRLGWR